MPLSTIFQLYIVAVNCIDGGNWGIRENPRSATSQWNWQTLSYKSWGN